jgi:hypothetical protein
MVIFNVTIITVSYTYTHTYIFTMFYSSDKEVWLLIYAGRIAIHRIAHIRHKCRKTTVSSCHRCLIKTGVEKMNDI